MSIVIPFSSQSLLQESCQHEKEHVERRRREAQDEITRAQRVVSYAVCTETAPVFDVSLSLSLSSSSVIRSRDDVLLYLVPFI